MTIRSIIRLPSLQFQIVEIEVALIPGLPQIHVLGLPDAHLKESVMKLRASLRARGFKLPRGQQILVQVRPSYIRKSSRGLDLALAAAIAFKLDQLQDSDFNIDLKRSIFYGELSLDGKISTPADLTELGCDNLLNMSGNPIDDDFPTCIVTGKVNEGHPLADCVGLDFLNEINEKTWELKPAQLPEVHWQRPDTPVDGWPESAARVLEIIAVGEHSALFCGPRGSGKTTLIESVPSFLARPTGLLSQDIRRWKRKERGMSSTKIKTEGWRPFVRPHHTTSARGIVGGGVPVTPGEMTRAHGGILFLDELLEFEPIVQDALREPLDHGHVTLRRGREWSDFPARFLFLAATNLCPCGNYIPKYAEDCSCSNKMKRDYRDRLSGPLLDRIEMVEFTHAWSVSQPICTKEDVAARVKAARTFRASRLGAMSLIDASSAGSEMRVQKPGDLTLRPEGSRRRNQAFKAVARTIADLALSERVLSKHEELARGLTLEPFELLFQPVGR